MPHFAAMMNGERVSNCLFRYFLSQLHSSADTEWTHALLEMKCILKSTGWCKTSLDSSLDFPLFVSQNLLLPHFSVILDGFVTACVSVICPWQETHLWLYQGHSFLITDSFGYLPVKLSLSKFLLPPAWFFPDFCQIQQLKNCPIYTTDCSLKSVWAADRFCQTGIFPTKTMCFFQGKHSWPLPVLQTAFHRPCSELVGNSTIQMKFCLSFCAFCGVRYLSSSISIFISASS